MKKVLFLLSLVFSLILVPTTYAATQRIETEGIATLEENEVIDGNYYTGGEIVEIYGTVNGDVYAAGGQVIIDAKINGDLIVAGGTVTILGTISQDVRAAGGQVNIDARIGKNLSVAGGNLDLSQSTIIGNALHIAGGNLTINSSIANEVLAAGGNLTFRGSSGNLEARVGNLLLASGSKIKGNVDYWASEEPTISNEATISGTVTSHQLPEQIKAPSQTELNNIFKSFSIASKLVSITTTFLVGLILIKLFPNCTQNTVTTAKTRLWASLGLGLATVIITPIILLLLFITVLAIPFSLISLVLFLIYLYFARVYIIIALGSFITQKVSKKTSQYLFLFIGIITYYALTFIPFLGGLVKLLIVLAGLGAGIISHKATYHDARTKKVF